MQKIKAIDLVAGDVIYWRTGNVANVVSVDIRPDCVYVVCGGSIHIYDRELKRNQVIMVVRSKAKVSKPKCHPYKEFYDMAYSYLVQHLPDGMTEKKLNKYFVSENANYNSVQELFERFITSAQNYQGMPNAIKFESRKAIVKKILYGYNLDEILEKWDVESLYQHFRNEFKVTSEDSKMNSWHKWSNSIIDTAKFLKEFKDVNQFKQFAGLFKFNVHTRMALPLLISQKIKGIGFALACDALKELGFVEYPKPDVHLMDIMSEIDMCERNEIAVFETIVKISDKCRETNKSVTPYKIDKILWLIGSGNFYEDNKQIKSMKKDFIAYMKEMKVSWNV